MNDLGEKNSSVRKGRKGQGEHFSEKEFCGVGMTFTLRTPSMVTIEH